MDVALEEEQENCIHILQVWSWEGFLDQDSHETQLYQLNLNLLG